MNEHEQGVQLGLRGAAQYLQSEADDLEERKKGQVVMMSAKELADFLRMHADAIRELKVTRGR